MKAISILVTKILSSGLKLIGRGGSLPGQMGLKIDSSILNKLKFRGPVVVVTGTNGKTSTANMISDMFEKAGKKVISNRKGDNLKEGIATTLLTNASLDGMVQADAIVLECDELNIKYILPNIPVTALVVTNFFRDQLDRAKEMELLIESIENVLPAYEQTLVLNGNDPNVVRLALKAPKAHKVYFGLAKNQYSTLQTQEANEGKFCPNCGGHLVYSFYQYSHVGHFKCSQCNFKTPFLNVECKDINLDDNTFTCFGHKFKCPYDGMYSMYNCAAVLAVGDIYGIELECVDEVFAHAPQPKGRNEKFDFNGKKAVINLIKNPTGANEVLKVIEKDPSEKTIVISLNDREQDGTDISWIYDTYFEKIMTETTESFICTGARAYDMALRLQYGGYKGNIEVYDSIDEAVSVAMKKETTVYAIATYTALLPTRAAIVKEGQSHE